MYSPLPAGHEVLAAMFGDFVYLPIKPSAACPLCGKPLLLTKMSRDYIVCVCGLWEVCELVTTADNKWAVVPMATLLKQPRNKLYLPTPGVDSPWVDRQELQNKYDEYLEEKRQCLERVLQVA